MATTGDGAPLLDSTRLCELESLTRKYGQLGQFGMGLATFPAGLCLIGAGWASGTGRRQAFDLLAAAAPLAFAVSSVTLRGRYQRHGTVFPPPWGWELAESSPTMAELNGWAGWLLHWLWIVLSAVRVGFEWGSRNTAAVLPAMAWLASAAVTTGLLWRSSPRPGDTWWASLAIAWLIVFRSAWRGDDTWDAALLVGFGAVLLGIGILGHLMFRRLERRLKEYQVAT